MKGKLNKLDNGWMLLVDNIMYATDENAPYARLSVKNCESIDRGYDLDELAYDYSWNHQSDAKWGGTIDIFKAGFQKALEIIGDKKFSEEDIKNAMDRVWDWSEDDKDKDCSSMTELRNKHIQSLQQNEWDCIVEMEKVKDETKIIGAVKGVKGSGNKITTYKSVPKLDVNGCLILKRI